MGAVLSLTSWHMPYLPATTTLPRPEVTVTHSLIMPDCPSHISVNISLAGTFAARL